MHIVALLSVGVLYAQTAGVLLKVRVVVYVPENPLGQAVVVVVVGCVVQVGIVLQLLLVTRHVPPETRAPSQ